MTEITSDHSPGATGEYSATKAPENRKHVTSAEPTTYPKLKPGGAAATPVDVGMSGLPHEKIPTAADTREPGDQGDKPEHGRRSRKK